MSLKSHILKRMKSNIMDSCICWLKLDGPNQLYDLISKNAVEMGINGGEISYDLNKGMYKIVSPNQGETYTARLKVDLTSLTKDFTLLAEMFNPSGNKSHYSCGMCLLDLNGPRTNSNKSFLMVYLKNGEWGWPLDRLNLAAIVFGNSKYTRYYGNGSFENLQPINQHLAQNWKDKYRGYIHIGGTTNGEYSSNDQYFSNVTWYCRNYLIFNKTLTDNEIKEVFNNILNK